MDTLKDKIALVTGASKGIGAETAKALAKNGATVIVNYNTNKQIAEEVVQAIHSQAGKAVAMQADISNGESVANLFQEIIRQYGKLDILVNNAGISILKPIENFRLEEYEKVMDTNVKGVFLSLQQAAHYLADKGSIVNLSSTVTRTLFPGYGVYAASKAAVEQLTRVFAKEVGKRGINVNSVSPGPTSTDLFLERKSEELIKTLAAGNAFNRLGTPADIACVIAFLVSDEAKWISGQNIGANGAMA